jgi:hypothetical protein
MILLFQLPNFPHAEALHPTCQNLTLFQTHADSKSWFEMLIIPIGAAEEQGW